MEVQIVVFGNGVYIGEYEVEGKTLHKQERFINAT